MTHPHEGLQEPALKPCPWCAGRAVMRRDDDPGYPWYVTFDHADSCPMYAVPTDLFRSFSTEAEAVIAWTPHATCPAVQDQGLCDALERIAGKNDLSGVPDDEVESAARNALYECELIARAALSALPQQAATDEGDACPFCGCADTFVERSDFSSSYVVCNNCSARGPVECQEDDDEDQPGKDAAIRSWSKRSPFEALAQIEHARSVLVARHLAKVALTGLKGISND